VIAQDILLSIFPLLRTFVPERLYVADEIPNFVGRCKCIRRTSCPLYSKSTRPSKFLVTHALPTEWGPVRALITTLLPVVYGALAPRPIGLTPS
jgi:hypothetical protein